MGWGFDVVGNAEPLAPRVVAVIGATSLVGDCLLPLLAMNGWKVVAYSRNAQRREVDGIVWRKLYRTGLPSSSPPVSAGEEYLPWWICVAPIWVLSDYLSMFEKYGARRVVVLSSTSRFTKSCSSDPVEKNIASRLAEGEESIRKWAEGKGVEWVVLRPTLIYGLGRDKNISEIVSFIRRFGFFPVFGSAHGLRQPLHAEDVAAGCLAALESQVAANHAYNLSGGEVLPYREMVVRVFRALQRRPMFVSIPLGVFRFIVACIRILPRYRHCSAAMAERMKQDLVFDHSEAARDLGFSPRPFQIQPEDLSL